MRRFIMFLKAVRYSFRWRLSLHGLYWCRCCEHYAHADDPCDCAYQTCRGRCVRRAL